MPSLGSLGPSRAAQRKRRDREIRRLRRTADTGTASRNASRSLSAATHSRSATHETASQSAPSLSRSGPIGASSSLSPSLPSRSAESLISPTLSATESVPPPPPAKFLNSAGVQVVAGALLVLGVAGAAPGGFVATLMRAPITQVSTWDMMDVCCLFSFSLKIDTTTAFLVLLFSNRFGCCVSQVFTSIL